MRDMGLSLNQITNEVSEIVNKLGWHISEKRVAGTGTFYLEIFRTQQNQKEWIVLRIANHKQFYHHWLIVYSISPSEISIEDLNILLQKPFGTIGDIL